MAIDFPSSPTVGQTYGFGGINYVFTAQGVWATAGVSTLGIIGGPPQGRLTLQAATPVMTTTQAAKTTIFYSPYTGDQIPLYNGSAMVMTTFTELSVATTDTTKNPAAVGASQVLDWFIWSDAGTLRISHGPAWTNDTTRSAGTALVRVNGILLNNAAITNGPAASRGTYVGTTRSNASSQLDWIYGGLAAGGTAGFFGVWNTYNRVVVVTTVSDSNDYWTYTGAAWRPSDNSPTMRVNFVQGLAEDGVQARFNQPIYSQAVIGVGLNTTSAFSGVSAYNNDSTDTSNVMAEYVGVPGVGFHFLSALEFGGAGVGQFVGDNGNSAKWQSGLNLVFRA